MITTTHEYAYFNGHPLISGGPDGWLYCRDLHVHVLTTGTHRAEVWHDGDDSELVITDLGTGATVKRQGYGIGHCGAQPFEDAAAYLAERERRTFTQARKEQGFRSQAHLDAFYVAYDHTKGCAVCSGPGPAAWSEADASWQPTSGRCDTGRELERASFAYLA